MFKNVNCIFAENPGGWCKNKNIKRTLWILARCCVKYFDDDKECKYCKQIPRPRGPTHGQGSNNK